MDPDQYTPLHYPNNLPAAEPSWSDLGAKVQEIREGGTASTKRKTERIGWGRLLATLVFFQVWNCLVVLFPHFHRKKRFYSRKFSMLWIQPLPQVTQTFTCHTTYMFSSSGSKTCLEISEPGKKNILEIHAEKVSVGRAFFPLCLVGKSWRKKKNKGESFMWNTLSQNEQWKNV